MPSLRTELTSKSIRKYKTGKSEQRHAWSFALEGGSAIVTVIRDR